MIVAVVIIVTVKIVICISVCKMDVNDTAHSRVVSGEVMYLANV